MGKLGKIISLKEASKISGYHPDYLSSLIRNNQLAGQKIGRNWYTTKEALRDYNFEKKPSFKFFITRKRIKIILVMVLIVIIAGFWFSMKIESENVDSDETLKSLNEEVVEVEVISFANVRN